MVKTFFVLLTVSIFVGFISASNVPSFMKICGRRNPKLDECVVDAVKALLPYLAKGIPQLAIPPVEPLYVDYVELTNLKNFHAVARDVNISGLTTHEVHSFHTDLEKQTLEFDITVPTFVFDAQCELNIQILVPIVAKGSIHLVTDKVRAKVFLRFKKVQRNGQTYLMYTSMSTDLDISDFTVTFTPVEGPDHPLATAINEVLLKNKVELITTMKPNIQKSLGTRILQMVNNICKRLTYDELYPDRE